MKYFSKLRMFACCGLLLIALAASGCASFDGYIPILGGEDSCGSSGFS